MLRMWTIGLIGALLCCPVLAESIKCEGVLGNSGEQGSWLVKRDTRQHRWIGMGVVQDKQGALWERFSSHGLSRFAPDGRFLGHYRLPNGHEAAVGILTHAGDELVALLHDGGLYALSTDAAPGSEARRLSFEGIRTISRGSCDGRLAAIDRNGRLLLLRIADGSLEELPSVPNANGVELMPDGTLYVFRHESPRSYTHKFVNGLEVTDGWPREYGNFQAVGSNFFTYGYHSTIARYSADFQAAPGVVLGGASGSVISFLEGNEEVNHPIALAMLGPNRYALASNMGYLHIIRWQPEKKQFAVVRRIGAVAKCAGLALDRAGNIRCESGCWHWDDLPDTPQRFSGMWVTVPPAMTDDDQWIATFTYDRGTLFHAGPINDFPKYRETGARFDVLKEVAGTVMYRQDKGQHQTMLVVNPQGQGLAFHIGAHGEFYGQDSPVTLRPAAAVAKWTALAKKSHTALVGAADGQVVELTPDGKNWQESRRWNSWDNQPDQKFGSRIVVAADADRLWVTDRDRHRVLCFSMDGKKLLASFGTTDQPGDDLDHLREPDKIAARGDRAVVFDSANQRLMKLRIR